MFRHLLLVLALSLVSVSHAEAQSIEPSPILTAAPNLAPRDVGGAFWRVDGSFESTLHIRNLMRRTSIDVTPVLWMEDGTELDLSPVSVDREVTADIDIGRALASLPPRAAGHRSVIGSAGIRYSGPWDDAIVATVEMKDIPNSLVFISHTGSVTGVNPRLRSLRSSLQRLSGVWWQQTSDTRPFVSIVNSSASSEDLQIVLADGLMRSKAAKDIVIPAGSAKLVYLDDLADKLAKGTEMGSLDVTYVGQSSRIVIEAGLEGAASGFSAPIPLLTDNARKVRNLIAAETTSSDTRLASIGVQVGIPESRMQYPEDTVFSPYGYARNLSDSPTQVKIQAVTTTDKPRSTEIGLLTLAAHEARNLDLSILTQRALPNFSGEITYVFEHTVNPEPLVIATGSTAKDSSYAFSVDPLYVRPEAGKLFCNWTVEDGNDTMMTFWNGGQVLDDAEVDFSYRGGEYRMPIRLEPNAAMTINLKQLIDSRVPGLDGNTFPSGALRGTARLLAKQGTRRQITIQAHASVYNVLTATCYEVCPTCNRVIYTALAPGNASVTLGDTSPYAVDVFTQDNDFYEANANSWTSSNTGIASVDTSGNIFGISEGSLSLSADYIDEGVPSWSDGSLCQYPLPQCPRYHSDPVTPVKTLRGTTAYLFSGSCQTDSNADGTSTLQLISGYATQFGGACNISFTYPQSWNPPSQVVCTSQAVPGNHIATQKDCVTTGRDSQGRCSRICPVNQITIDSDVATCQSKSGNPFTVITASAVCAQ